MTGVYAAGLAVLAAAALLPVRSPRLGALAAAAGAALLGLTGFVAAAGWSFAHLHIGSWLGFGASSLLTDRLGGVFLALVGVTGAAVSLALAEHPPRRLVGSLHALLLLALALVIGADQAFLFLLAWEAVTVSIFLIAGAERERPGTLVAAYFGGTMNKLGGGSLLAAFALMYAHTGSFSFAAWADAAAGLGSGLRGTVFALLLVGFGTKIGLLPFQGPLPLGYAAAPGAASASLSVALNVGFYGLWRLVFDLLRPASAWQGELVLVVGALGGLVGILYAIGQDEVKSFLGFSSVEHAGIVLIGFGVALIGQSVHEPKLAAAGILAATLHLVMHGVGKTLAFVAADRVERTAGGAMGALGGLGRQLPRTAAGFGLAVVTLAAIPPFGGFVSEWFTFEALLQGFRLEAAETRLLMALAAALLALTAGLALLAFAKLFGGIFLGAPRSARGAVREPSAPAAGVGLLALTACLLGVVAPWEIRWLGRGFLDVLGFDLSHTTISHPLVLGPVYPGFSVLAPTWLAIALPGFALASFALVRATLRPSSREAPPWTSGSAVTVSAVQYTPASYSNPIRVVLRGLYGFTRRLDAAPSRSGLPASLTLETRIVPAFEHYLYSPLTAVALRLSSRVRRLQGGSLSLYLAYMLIVLIVVLALIPALRD